MDETKTTGTPKLNRALAKAQGAMGAAVRDATNPAFLRDGRPSAYATLASVIDAIREPFVANELAHWQATLCDDASVTVTTYLLHSSGEERHSSFRVPVMKKDPQGFASATTYSRRVGLMASAGIAPDDDDDGNTHSTDAKVSATKTAPRSPDEPLDLAIASKWAGAFGELGVVEADLAARLGHPSTTLTRADLPVLKAMLTERKAVVAREAEAAFASAKTSLASPSKEMARNAAFRVWTDKILAATSAAEATLIASSSSSEPSFGAGEHKALARAAQQRGDVLRDAGRSKLAPLQIEDVSL